MTTERIVVARVESIFLSPILPRIATAEAKMAESMAYPIHMLLRILPHSSVTINAYDYKKNYVGNFAFIHEWHVPLAFLRQSVWSRFRDKQR